jgi:alkylated DNA repair dioxygenase AlkB
MINACTGTPSDQADDCKICPHCNYCKNKCWNYYGGWDFCNKNKCECIITTEKSYFKSYKINEEQLISLCVNEIKDKLIVRPKIMIYGKECSQNRSIGFFSDTSIGYKYSGKIAESQKMTESLLILLNKVNTLLKADFNGILINKYENGNDYIGPHSDDERMLDKIGVVSISYGAVRTFRIRNKKDKSIEKDISTIPNTIFHMGGDFQKEFTHEIPKEKKILQERYSFTFRKHIE